MALSTPRQLGGAGGPGTNLEQLFAAGYAACYIGAMKVVAARQKLALPGEPGITAEVGIGPMTGKAGAFGIPVAMPLGVPRMGRAALAPLVAAAYAVCPYSSAARGNIDVSLDVA